MLARLGWREGQGWSMGRATFGSNELGDSTLTCNFPRGLLVRDHETGTPFSRSCTIACHYHKQPVACVLKQEITVHTQGSQINSEAGQSTHDRCHQATLVNVLLQVTPGM